jgi:hypothetical protein
MSGTINSGYRLVGLETIKIGDVGTGGLMGTDLTTLKNVAEGSAFLSLEAPGKTELFNEDSDLADIVINTNSAKFVEFALRDMDVEVFELAFGGTGSGTSWDMPLTAVVVSEKSIEITSKEYGGQKLRFHIPRVAVRGGGDLRFSKTESGTITFTCDVLLPETSTPPIHLEII